MNKIHRRSDAIDIMKGIGIIFVILGHTIYGALYEWIYTFHMPLFFIVAGLFLNPNKEIFVKRVKSLIVPYFIFAIITYLYWRFFELQFRPIDDDLNINTHFLDIFWQTTEFKFNVALWFLPCLFFTTILANLIFLYVKKSLIIKTICILWIVAVSLYIPNTQSIWIKEVWCAFPFLTIGFLCNQHFHTLETKLNEKPIYLKTLALLPLIGIFFIPHGGHMHASIYPNGYSYFLLCAVICVAAIFILSTTLTSQKWLSWLGRNTLVIMCLHEPIKRIVIKIFSMIMYQDTNMVRNSILMSILITAIIIITIVPICKMVNKRLPWMLGKF